MHYYSSTLKLYTSSSTNGYKGVPEGFQSRAVLDLLYMTLGVWESK